MHVEDGAPGEGDEFAGEFWEEDFEDVEDVDDLPTWRRPLLIGVAVVTAVALALLPIYNVFFSPTIADNGLEVCGIDYCMVEEAVRAAGLGDQMSGLFNTILDDEAAALLTRQVTDHLGVSPVAVAIVDDLDGRIGGVYDPESRSIAIERPARAWTVLHEASHVVETGHGPDFQSVLIEVTREFGAE